MTQQQKESLYRDLAQIFIVSWWSFEQMFDEIMKVLDRHGFKQVENQ